MKKRIGFLFLCLCLALSSAQAGPVPEVPYDGPYLLEGIPFGIDEAAYDRHFAGAFGIEPGLVCPLVFGHPALVEAHFYENRLRWIQVDFLTAFGQQPAQIQTDDYGAATALFMDLAGKLISTYGPIDDAELVTTRYSDSPLSPEGGQYELPLEDGLPDLDILALAHGQESSFMAILRLENIALTFSDRGFEGTNPYAIWLSYLSYSEPLSADYLQHRTGVYPPAE